MIRVRISTRPLKALCFDIENKPGTFGPGDYTHGKVTALAAQFIGGPGPAGWVMRREKPDQMRRCLKDFRAMWDVADVVVGHNIRRHDIKLLNGFCTSLDEPLLAKRRAIDTYMDQPRMTGISRSLENLAARWGCEEKKVHLSEYDWEQAYDGVPWATEKMRERCRSDVRINIWLYFELRKRGLL